MISDRKAILLFSSDFRKVGFILLFLSPLVFFIPFFRYGEKNTIFTVFAVPAVALISLGYRRKISIVDDVNLAVSERYWSLSPENIQEFDIRLIEEIECRISEEKRVNGRNIFIREYGIKSKGSPIQFSTVSLGGAFESKKFKMEINRINADVKFIEIRN